MAREYPEKSSRELACHITDNMDYFISESSVYRILKAYDLVTSPVYTVISAKDKFKHPTTRINQLWQTDFSYLKVIDWGWYYLSTVMDDYSRYILAWRLCRTMMAKDVKKTLDMAIEWTGVEHVHVVHRPRLLSDNGSAYVSKELKHYHEAINNVTPRDKYFGRDKEILKNRMKIKKQTIQQRKKINKMMVVESLPNEIN